MLTFVNSLKENYYESYIRTKLAKQVKTSPMKIFPKYGKYYQMLHFAINHKTASTR